MLLTALAVMLASPPPATDADEGKTIVVTGERNTEERVREFVGALTWAPAGRRLGRFELPVCAVAVGLAPPQAARLAERMHQVAEAAGIRAGGDKCVANVVVVVASDKAAFMAELYDKHPNYFLPLPRRKIRELVRQTSPATAWQLKGPSYSARGTEIPFDPDLGYYTNRTTEPVSRINNPARPQFDAAVVVVERSALAGLTTTQLADYAALRAFTGADPARLGKSNAPTILRVLDAPMGSEVPITLTEWDLGFLRGYYSSPRNLNTAAQRSSIREGVAKETNASTAE